MNTKTELKTAVWRHYGSPKYDPAMFKPAAHKEWMKPDGGLWVSPKDSDWGWIDWCEAEDFGHDRTSEYFDIMVQPSARIIVIDSEEDAKTKLKWTSISEYHTWINWRETIMDGWDMVFLTEHGQDATRFGTPSLYGWDCESAVILNPEIIISNF